MTTAALTLETWLDPSLQQFSAPRVINWHAALVDPYTKLLTALPAGGSLSFSWTLPPVTTTPQAVTPQVNDSVGVYHVNLPLTTTMIGKVLLSVVLRDGSNVVLDTATTLIVVYGSGQ